MAADISEFINALRIMGILYREGQTGSIASPLFPKGKLLVAATTLLYSD